MKILRILGLLCMLLMAPFAMAQTNGPDYAAWDLLAGNVEGTIAERIPSEVYLTQQRANISQFRQSFAAAQTQNTARLAALQKQIETLGPLPDDGSAEPEEISTRRTELQGQLDTLKAARVRALEAYTRADGLIDQIDTLLAAKNTDRLMTSGPSPLNPASWPMAWSDMRSSVEEMGKSIALAWNSDDQRGQAQEQLPVIIALWLFGAFLMFRARHLISPFARLLTRYEREASHGFSSFIRSLAQFGLMYLGALMIVWGLQQSGLYGVRLEGVLQAAPTILLRFFMLTWIGVRVFNPNDDQSPLRGLPETAMRQGWRLVWGISAAMALRMVIQVFADEDGYSAQTLSVIAFVFSAYCGLMLVRLGAMILRSKALDAATQSVSLRKPLGQAAMAVGGVSILGALAGYTAASAALLYPFIYTLAIIAATLVLFEAVRDVFALISSNPVNGREGLLPVLTNSALVLASIPAVLLIWGMRVSDLQEYWQTFTAGFSLGGVTLSPTVFLVFVIVFSIGYFITRAIQRALRSAILPKTKMDAGAQTAVVSGFGYVGVFIAALVAITMAGLDLSSLAIVAGALSVGIGFGLQNIVSNFVSGIILLIERPISEGDWIEVNGNMGYVRDISVRSTRIETFDRSDVIVPNADLISGAVTNYTRGNTVGRIIVKVGVAYGSDTRQVERILQDIAEAHPLVSLNPAPFIVFVGFGADSLDFEIRAILRDITGGLGVKNELHHQIAERFAAEGLEIPFMQRDIWIRNPEALTGVENSS